jgi:hypothetical protein
MRLESRRTRAALSVLLLATAVGYECAQGGLGSVPLSSALPEEAPKSVFSAKLGQGPDDDAELLVSGSWSATALASIDLQTAPGLGLSLASAQPFLFTQSPDLSLSFLLYKKFFVEARVANDVTQASYAAGYRGGSDELLREIRVGNAGISFPSLPFLAFGEGSYRSFGAAATIQSDNFTGKAMVRYDQADRVVKRFVGSTEVEDTEVAANAFIMGQYFLTFKAPAPNLALFVQSVSGTYLDVTSGDRYRKLDASEYSYSAITGVASLSFAATTRVLAYYTGGINGGSGLASDAVTLQGGIV